jgi:hypothetical protein
MGGVGQGYTPEELRRIDHDWQSLESLALLDEAPERTRATRPWLDRRDRPHGRR